MSNTKISTALTVAMLNGMMTSIGGSGGMQMRIYSGAVPASANASTGSAVLLTTITDPADGPLLMDVDGVVLQKPATQTWMGTNVASGNATFYRLVRSDDADDASILAPRIQGSVGVVGADVNLESLNLVAGQPQTIKEFVISFAETQAA